MDDFGQFFASIPPAVKQAVNGAIGTFVLAFLGRLLWHVREVQHQRRRFWSLHLVWELLTALSIGYVADGAAEWLGLTGKPALAAIIVIAYLGPRGVEEIIVRGLKAYQDKGGKV